MSRVIARLLHAFDMLVCWAVGHAGLGSICHRCGNRYRRKL